MGKQCPQRPVHAGLKPSQWGHGLCAQLAPHTLWSCCGAPGSVGTEQIPSNQPPPTASGAPGSMGEGPSARPRLSGSHPGTAAAPGQAPEA